jgi:hypothetical protein
MSTKQRRLSAFFKNVNGKWKEEEEEEEKTELGHLINFLFFHLYINRSIDFFFLSMISFCSHLSSFAKLRI